MIEANTQENYREYATVGDAAELLGVSIDTIRRWEKAGKLKAERLDGKNRYFAIDELEAFKSTQPLSTTEVAVLLGVSPSTVRRLEEQGILKPERNHNGKRLYDRKSVNGFVNQPPAMPIADVEAVQAPHDELVMAAEIAEMPSLTQQPAVPSHGSVHRTPSNWQAPHLKIPRLHVKQWAPWKQALFAISVVSAGLILMLSTLFLTFPKTMTRVFGYEQSSQAGKRFNQEPGPSLFARALRPFTNSALNVVEVVNPALREEISPQPQFDNVNDVFTTDKDGNVVSKFVLSVPNSSYIHIPDQGLVSNLNSEFVQGRKPGENSGDLAVLPLSGKQIKDKSITSAQIADGAIQLSNLSSALLTSLGIRSGGSSGGGSTYYTGQAGPQGPAGPAGPAGPQGVPGTNGTGTINEVIAGLGLSGGGTSGTVAVDLQTGDSTQIINDSVEVKLATSGTTSTTGTPSGLEITSLGLRMVGGCTSGQILKWNGSVWACSADSGGGGGSVDVQTSDGSTVVTGASNIQFGPTSSSSTQFALTNLGGGQVRVQLGTNVLQTTNYAATLDTPYVNVGEAPSAGDITGSFSGGLSVAANAVTLGADTTGNYLATLSGATGLTVTGSGSESAAASIALDVTTTGTTGTSSGNSGLEIGADGLRLLGGCSNNQILKWNGSAWACSADNSGAGALDIKENGTTVTTSATSLDFLGNDFIVTNSISEADISIDYGNSGITRRNGTEIITGNWNFNDSSFGVQDNADNTKKVVFELSGITAGTTRILTAPDVNGTLITSGNLASITSVGTISSGVWQGSMIGSQYGGTGVNGSSAANGQLLIGNGSGYALGTLTQGSGVSISNGAGSITIAAILGASISNSEIDNDAVTLGTQTTGSFVSSIGTLTGLSTTGNSGEGSTPTLSVIYGSAANTSVQGSTSISVSAGTNLSGGGSITLGAGGTVTLNTVANPNFSTSVTSPLFTNAGQTVLSATGAGSDITLTSADQVILTGFNCTTFDNGGVLTVNASGVLSCDNDDGGAAGTVTGSGTTNRIPYFSGASSLGNSWLLQNSSTLELDNTRNLSLLGGNLDVTGTGTFSGVITANGNLTVQTGDIFTINGDAFTDLTGTGLTISSGVLNTTLGTSISNGEIDNDAVTLGAQTTGGYVASIGTLTGLSTTGNSGEGSNPTLSVLYGSVSNTAAQGNTSFTCANGTGNLSGGGNTITVGTGGTCGAINTVSNPSFSGLITGSSSTTGLALTGAPNNAGNTSLIQIGSAIAGGNSSTDGGTYLGLNAPASGAGSAADLMNLQVNGVSRFHVTNAGNVTATTFIGSLTGNASTATALAANPSDCAANQFANVIAANGNLTCASITDAEVPNNITIDLASTATALATNPTDCSANQFATTIAANGNLTCAAITDADVSDTLTASLFVGSGSSTTAIDLATAEVAGNLRANNLQSAAADLGAADVTVNFGNTNGSFNTNITTDGTITATTFIGAVTGNASTATALAANPSDCAANQFATTIAANGNLTCASLTDGDIPNNITIDLAATATALAANPTDCSANQFATTIAANGNLTCASITDADVSDTLTSSLFVGSGSTTTAVDLATAEVAGNLRATNLQSAGSDLGAANVSIDLSNTNGGGFVTNITVDGTIIAATFSGALNGNATTATSLASNPSDCAANQFATTIAANGNLSCTALTDADVPDSITINNATNATNATNLIGSGSTTNAVDLATAEVAGNLRATNLQSAAADLGAANVNVDLSNTNGAFVTSLTLDGTITASSFSGSLTGNASTATALAANPSDCAANQFANVIAANGNLTCASITDAEVPNNITIDLASTATALATNPTDCSANQFATTIAANGNLTCAAITDADVSDTLTASLFVGSGSSTTAIDLATAEVAGNLRATNLQTAGADLGAANVNIDFSNTNGGGFVTNLTLDGSITAATFSGALSGNASTASSLAANPSDCSANQFATTIAANGNLTCTALTDGDIPNSITIDLAATATALAANPTDCSANQFANAIASNGNLTCASITDADVSDTLTSSLFVGSGSTTTAIDLATGEVSGNLRATNLQSAGADLGAANVTIDLSNTNSTFVTNLTVDGTITAATFTGALNGNSSTASSLAANPTDCSVNQFANTIAANGNLTCVAIAANNLPSVAADLGTADVTINLGNTNGSFNTNLTIDGTVTAATFIGALTGNASTATALAANPTDCSANQFANTIAANGNLTCTSLTDADIPDSITINNATSATNATNLIGSGSTTNAVDLATAEVAGNLRATNLQSAATDLGAANVTIDLGNTNGSFVTNLTVDGNITAATFSGSLAGNASTATALASNPTDCSANQFANAIVASGNLTCAGITDADVSDTLTASILLGSGSTTNAVDLATAEVSGVLGASNGGTGISSYTAGDLIYATGATTLAKLAAGLNGQCLQVVSGAPAWSGCASGSLFTIAGTSGSAQSVNGGDTVTIAAGSNITTTAASGPIVTVGIINNPSFSGLITGSSSTTGLALTGVPNNAGNTSLLQLGAVIAGGNSVTNGGTYIGLNAPSSGAGSAADLMNLQLNGVSKFLVTNAGDVTATTFIGALTGNASTASALAANPSDCSANQFATTIAANGNLTCTALTDGDIPNSITIDLAATATALAANPTDCSANQFANAIASNGNLTCASITDADVSDTLTSSLFVGSGSTTTAIDLATGEVSGNLRATNLQSAGADLGAANVTIDLSNTNSTFVTNLTVDGTITAASFSGALSGNATTATALAANPTDCSANQFATTIAANGNLTCSGITDGDIPNSITIDLATAATALATNPTDCSANQFATTIAANGNLTCAAITDADVSDTLTASLFVGSGSSTTAIDLATAEVAGNLRAPNLQSAATDLGAANVNIDLSNTNGAFVTNLTLDGTITASSFSGALTGNASTATALAANPTDCAANQFANVIAANGNLTCAAITDAEVPNNITIDLAATATALAANPSDCSANQFATTIAANGNLTCAALTDGDVPDALTVSASGSVVDGALSANVTKLGSAINLDTSEVTGQLRATNLQSAGTDLGAANVTIDFSNTNGGGFVTNLTVDGTITAATFSGALSGNASTATALAANPTDCSANQFATTIAANGNLTCAAIAANNLPSAAADLGAADVTINLGNTNDSFNTNLTLDGTVTATTFIGALTGNASTASALAANPTDCSANQFATTIAASGNLTCSALTDADIPDSITVTLAATATALAANPSDCSANQFATTIAANGNLSCAAITDADVPDNITITTSTLLTANAGLSVAKTFSVNSGSTQNIQVITFTSPADTSGTNVSQGINITPTVGNATAGTNTVNVINIDAFTGDAQVTTNALKIGDLTGTAASEIALNVGSGWDNVLSVGGTAIINGSGVVQSAGISGSYTSITGVGTISTGTWQGTAVADTYVSDTLTIGASSTVADGALSANVTKLGATITKDEITNSGTLGFSWADSEVADTLTVDWTGLQNYPTGCGGGQAVTAVGDTLTCGTFLTTESDTLASVTGRGATTSTASSFTGGATIRSLTVDTATSTDDRILVSITGGGAGRFDGTITSADLTVANKTWTLPNVDGTFITTGNLTNITSVGTIATGTWQATAVADTYVSDTLTIGASSTVSDSALSSNVTKLGATITKDEITNSGTLGFSWADSEVADNITLNTSTIITGTAGLSVNKTLIVNSGSTQNVQTITFASPADTSGTNVSQGLNITPTIGNATAGTNAANIINIDAVTGDAQVSLNALKIGDLTGTAAAEYALLIGTGWDTVLRVGTTDIINGSGVVQSAGISGTYGNLTGTGALDAGSITANFGSINVGTDAITTSGTIGTASTTTFTGAGATFSAAVAANSSITSTQATFVINASGTVDVQDTLNADSITSDAGMSVAAGQSYTGAGAVIHSSGAGTNLTFDSGTTGTIAIGTDASVESITLGSGNAVKTIQIGLGTSGNTISIGTNNTTLDTIGIGSALDTLTYTGNSSSTFVINGVTVTATEFNRLDGKDAALVDQNDLTTGDGAGATSSGSGLEVGIVGTGSGIGLIQGCANNEIMEWTDATSVWGCEVDDTVSDGRLKKDVTTVSSALDTLNQLRAVSYKYNDLYHEVANGTEDNTGTHFGFIAQEVQAILPDLVGERYGVGDYLGIDYQSFTGLLTSAVQELSGQVDDLMNLKDRVSTLEGRVSSLESNSSQSGATDENGEPVTIESLFGGQLSLTNGLTAHGNLTVEGQSEFRGNSVFNQLAVFFDSVIFNGEVRFNDNVSFGNNTGGYAVISASKQSVHVTFTKPYAQAPIITLALGEGKFARYSYKNVTSEGFDIVLDAPALENLQFSWTAINVNNPNTFVQL